MSFKRFTTARCLLAAIALIGAGILVLFAGSDKTLAQRLDTPRIAPVTKATWTPEQENLLKPLERDGVIYNMYATMANHPELARDWLVFASHVLQKNTLPERDREILVLRTAWLRKAEYAWAQHVRIGKAVGLSDEDINRIMEGSNAGGLGKGDHLLLKAAEELHKDAFVSDATWAALSTTYDTKQMMDMVFTVGIYNLVSMALNSFGVQLDEGLEGFQK